MPTSTSLNRSSCRNSPYFPTIQHMKKFMVRVTESINHDYIVEAENEDEAVEAYYRFNNDELKTKDVDGDSSWDRPWDVYEIEE